MIIYRCSQCPYMTTDKDGNRTCDRKNGEPVAEPEGQPSWCPLPEEDPNSV